MSGNLKLERPCIMKTYKEHYEYCTNTWDGMRKFTSPKYDSVYDLKVDNSLLDSIITDEYYDLIKKIRFKINEKIENNNGCFLDNTGHAIRVNEWNDIEELDLLSDMIIPIIEWNIFRCNVKIEFLHPYRNLTNSVYSKNESRPVNVQSSWQWHYDDCPPEFVKLFIHLNEVTEDNGCLKYIQDSDGSIPTLPCSRPAPGVFGEKAYAGSRIPENVIEKKLNEGSKVVNVVGNAGSYAICTPNIYHRASCPYPNTIPRDVLFFFIRPSIKRYSSYLQDTDSYLPERNVKQYNLD